MAVSYSSLWTQPGFATTLPTLRLLRLRTLLCYLCSTHRPPPPVRRLRAARPPPARRPPAPFHPDGLLLRRASARHMRPAQLPQPAPHRSQRDAQLLRPHARAPGRGARPDPAGRAAARRVQHVPALRLPPPAPLRRRLRPQLRLLLARPPRRGRRPRRVAPPHPARRPHPPALPRVLAAGLRERRRAQGGRRRRLRLLRTEGACVRTKHVFYQPLLLSCMGVLADFAPVFFLSLLSTPCARRAQHAALASERALVPIDEPHVERVFAGTSGWKLKLLMRSHSQYDDVHRQFVENWQKPGPIPRLQRIFKVEGAPARASRLPSLTFPPAPACRPHFSDFRVSSRPFCHTHALACPRPFPSQSCPGTFCQAHRVQGEACAEAAAYIGPLWAHRPSRQRSVPWYCQRPRAWM